ncbi:MAG: ATP-binding protein [archaeon]
MPKYEDVKFGEKGASRALLQIAKLYDAESVVREYLTNSYDAAIEGLLLNARVSVIPEQKRLIFSDNGCGMSLEKLTSLRSRIGESDKVEREDLRGNKGLGILSFASVGDMVHIVSREAGNPNQVYGYMQFINKSNIIKAFSEAEELDMDKLDQLGGYFDFGTRIIIDLIDPYHFEKRKGRQSFGSGTFGQANLVNLLSRLYTPALRKQDISILVERKKDLLSGRKTNAKQVEPIEYKGDILLETELEFQDMDKKIGQDKNLKLECLLLFNPKADTSKVAVYSRNVLVNNSVTLIPGFEKNKFWGCGKLSGYVNDEFVDLKLARKDIDTQSREFRIWLGGIDQIEEQLGKTVADRISREPKDKHKQDERVKRVWDAITDTLKNLTPLYDTQLYVRAGNKGVLRRVRGVSPSIGTTDNKQKDKINDDPSKGKPRRKNKVKGKKGGLYEPDEGGEEKKVAPKTKTIIECPILSRFSEEESHLRSKFDTKLGEPAIYISSIHEDYLRSLKDENSQYRYLLYHTSKELAHIEAANIPEGLVITKEEIAKNTLLRAEEIYFQAISALNIR